MSNREVVNLCEKKNQIQDLLQDIFNEYNRMNETKIQNNCEKDLEMRNMSDTIRTLELSEKQNIDEIRSLKKVICDYENIINELNSKYATLEEDKKEENRFDMLRTQAKEISEKDRERMEKSRKKWRASVELLQQQPRQWRSLWEAIQLVCCE